MRVRSQFKPILASTPPFRMFVRGKLKKTTIVPKNMRNERRLWGNTVNRRILRKNGEKNEFFFSFCFIKERSDRPLALLELFFLN